MTIKKCNGTKWYVEIFDNGGKILRGDENTMDPTPQCGKIG